MKQILVIGSRTSEPAERKALADMSAFVQTAMTNQQVETTVYDCHLDEVGYVLSNGTVAVIDLRNNRDLKEYDLVFFRGKLAAAINIASTVAQYLDMHNIPHTNTAYSARRAVGKVPQMLQLAHMGLTIPFTISAQAQYLGKLIEQYLTYPVVVKDVQGAHGNNNFLVNSTLELNDILAANPDVAFMAQEFIKSDGDYRVLLVGDQTAIIHRKGQGDTHLNNTSTGGDAKLIDLADFPEEIVADSRTFATSCEYEIAGVDVIIDAETGKYYFLEINSQPQLASGAFVELKSELLGNYFKTLLA